MARCRQQGRDEGHNIEQGHNDVQGRDRVVREAKPQVTATPMTNCAYFDMADAWLSGC